MKTTNNSPVSDTPQLVNDSPRHTVPVGLRLVLVASLILLLLASLSEVNKLPISSSPIPPPNEHSNLDTMIVPGMRIGPVTLGLSDQRMGAIMGPAQLRPQDSGIVHLFPKAGMVVYTENDRVVSVTVRSPIYKTRSGVGVDSDVSEVLSTLSSDYEMEGGGKTYKLHNWAEGWHMEIVDNKVSYIQITTKLTESGAYESAPK